MIKWWGKRSFFSPGFALAYIFSGMCPVLLFKCSSFLFSGNTIYLWRLLLENMHFLCYTPLLLLVYLFQGITAYPINHNHGNGRSESNPTIWPSSQTTSGWRMFHAINPWNAHSNGNKMVCTILHLPETRRDTNHCLSHRNIITNAYKSSTYHSTRTTLLNHTRIASPHEKPTVSPYILPHKAFSEL